MAGPTVVSGQAVAGENFSNNDTTTLTFASNVTAGNTLVQFTFGPTNTMVNFPSTGQNGWTRVGGYQDTLPSYGMTVEIWTRTALVGDGKTPPIVCSGYNLIGNESVMWELTPAAADQTNFGFVTGAGGTSTNLTTGAANTMALAACMADFNETSSIATTGGWTIDTTGPYGVEQAIASSGASVDIVIGASGFSDTVYGMLSLKSGSSTETANPVKLALSGVSFNGGGARTETANPVTLALSHASFNVHAESDAETAAATLVLGGVAFKINTVDVTAEPVLVNFYTF